MSGFGETSIVTTVKGTDRVSSKPGSLVALRSVTPNTDQRSNKGALQALDCRECNLAKRKEKPIFHDKNSLFAPNADAACMQEQQSMKVDLVPAVVTA